ncbi:hypothetical protein Tco_0629686 [Tanacetum coccineum]|uniref:Reverse transcriptase domain-containing protein n=1 Tax=Tanacetum coccineum TaxID=301880 RepID=A0ABQ4WTT4_9ASTR
MPQEDEVFPAEEKLLPSLPHPQDDEDDDEVDIEADDDEEEEEHPAPCDSEDRPEVTLPPRKRLGIALGPRYEIGESSSAAARPAGGLRADYGFVCHQGTPVVTDVTELSQRMREFETRVRRDTNKVYTRLDDEWSGRQLLAGRLNMLFRDRRAHAQVMSLCTTVLAQQSQIRELQSADRRRQTVITEMLAADHRRQKQLTKALKLIKRLQTQMAEFERQSTNGDDSHNSGTSVRRTERAARECTYTDFLKCQPLNFKGTEGVAAVGTLILLLNMGSTHVRQLVIDAVTVKGTDLTSYTQRFQELALLCGRMFSEESDKIEKYVGGLPDMIYGSVVASKPKTMQDAVEIATELMDKKIRTLLNQKDVKCSVEDTSQDHSEPTTKKQEANTVDPFTARNWCQEAIRGI